MEEYLHKKEIRELMCSMLIGDGTLYLRDGLFQLGHGPTQYDYLIWKQKLINKIFESKKMNRRMKGPYKVTYDNGKYVGYQSKLYWTEYIGKFLYSRCYKNKRKNFEYILKQLTSPIHLAIWLMDDGSEVGRRTTHKDGTEYLCNPYYKLDLGDCTDGQSNLVLKWFEYSYNIKPRRFKTKRGYWVVWFTAPDSKKIFLKIKPYLSQVASMRNKFWLSFVKY